MIRSEWPVPNCLDHSITLTDQYLVARDCDVTAAEPSWCSLAEERSAC